MFVQIFVLLATTRPDEQGTIAVENEGQVFMRRLLFTDRAIKRACEDKTDRFAALADQTIMEDTLRRRLAVSRSRFRSLSEAHGKRGRSERG